MYIFLHGIITMVKIKNDLLPDLHASMPGMLKRNVQIKEKMKNIINNIK